MGRQVLVRVFVTGKPACVDHLHVQDIKSQLVLRGVSSFVLHKALYLQLVEPRFRRILDCRAAGSASSGPPLEQLVCIILTYYFEVHGTLS
jgi:hypothetical protein